MKLISPRLVSVIVLTALTGIAKQSAAQVSEGQRSTPAETVSNMINDQELKENPKGENFCWHAAVGLGRYLDGFRLTGDTAWLNAGIVYYDFLIHSLDTDPDGYRGWIGPSEYSEHYWQDAVVGDAILMAGILDFCVFVLENDSLKTRYGGKANEYVEIAKKDFFEKWNKRAWHEDGPYGAYSGYDKFLRPNDLKSWIRDPRISRTSVSHPFNKQMDAGAVCLRLFRITGNKIYRDRAWKIFFTVKSHFQYFDNHYCWNYFEPITVFDVDLKNKDTRHGVWVHPWRPGYQAGEVERIAEAYHYGIVFDEQDMRRIINTNLDVMWNKDRVNPKFISSNGLGADYDTTGIAEFRAAWGHSAATKNAGELWTGLLDFDQTIRDLYELRFKNDRHGDEYLLYKKDVLSNPPGFKRKYAPGAVKVPAMVFTESRELDLATVLPHAIGMDKPSIIICQTTVPGELQIDLYSPTGQKVAGLYRGKIDAGQFMITWDGRDSSTKKRFHGNYRIRWTLGTGYREFPVEIR
jgi:hypothetical protein